MRYEHPVRAPGSASVRRLSRTLFPGAVMLLSYQRQWLRFDVTAGVTVAAYLIPQVMAYAVIAGLPPVAGLWAALGPLLVYAVMGSSRQLSVGPESTTALMTAVVLAPLAISDPSRYAASAAVLAILVGAVCLLAGLLRLGVLAELFSRPVLVGYMAGIAILMMIGQLEHVTRVPVSGERVIDQLESFLRNSSDAHVGTMVLAVGVFAVLEVISHFAPRVPGPLIGILGATCAVELFSLQDAGIEVVGAFAGSVPTPTVPDLPLGELITLILPAMGIAVVGFSDNVLTARTFATRRGEVIDPNAELFALAGANLSAGVLRGFPVSSSGSRTAIGSAVGSKSQLFSIVAAVTVLLTTLLAADILAVFPTAALGALVIFAARRLVDVGEFRRILRFRRSEAILAVATTVGVLGLGVLYGVLAAVAISILDLLRKIGRPNDGVLGFVPGVAGMHDVDDFPESVTEPGLVVYRYDAPLCFANAEDFRRRALAAVDADPGPVAWFLLNAEANVELDLTAVDALEALVDELGRRGVVFAVARIKHDAYAELQAAGLAAKIGTDRVFMTLPTAVAAYRQARGQAGPPTQRPR